MSEVRADVIKLLTRHWREVDVNHDDVPLDPDWSRYDFMEKLGWLYFVTARVNGKLVGYMTVFVNPHIHHRTTYYGTVDVMFLEPKYRTGWTGVRFIKFAEKGIRKLGAKVMRFDVKEHFKNKNGRDVGRVLQYLGFDAVDVSYMKVFK